MSSLNHRIGIAISVFTLVIGLNYPVLAKPVLTSQLTPKAAVAATGSRQPTEAILANIRLKSSSPVKVSKATTRSTMMVKPVARTTKTSQDTDLSSQGTATFTKASRSNPRSNKSSGIDRWVN